MTPSYFVEPIERDSPRGMISNPAVVNFPAQRVGEPVTEGGSMQQPSAEFVNQVEVHMEQALQEGWVAAKNTATTLAVGVGVLLAHVEAVADPGAARMVKRLVLTAIGVL